MNILKPKFHEFGIIDSENVMFKMTTINLLASTFDQILNL